MTFAAAFLCLSAASSEPPLAVALEWDASDESMVYEEVWDDEDEEVLV